MNWQPPSGTTTTPLGKTKLALAVALVMNFPTQLVAAEVELPSIDVVGKGEQAIAKLPGAVAVITKEDLALSQPLSVQDALKAVPGIVVREEEGYNPVEGGDEPMPPLSTSRAAACLATSTVCLWGRMTMPVTNSMLFVIAAR